MNNALKFLLLAVGCILVVGLISLGMFITEKGKTDAGTSLAQYSEAAGSADDIELKIYDGNEVSGSEVKRLIKNRAGDEYLSIKVINGKNNEEDYIHGSTIEDNILTEIESTPDDTTISENPGDNHYINDNGIFKAELFYDSNDILACIRFQQQK